MRSKIFMLCGILATFIYFFTVTLGGALWREYSHIAQPVSDLIATGAPNKTNLDPLFGLYNILTILFGFGLFQMMRAEQKNRRKVVGIVGALVLVAEGIFGGITLFFPEDTGGMGAGISTTGTMHIIFAGLCSLTSMVSILLIGIWLKNDQRFHKYGRYSFLSVALIFLSGGMAAISIPMQSTLGGLLERITMGFWLQWMFVIGAVMYASRAPHVSPTKRHRLSQG